MDKAKPNVAQQIAEAASAFEIKRTGVAPQSVSVVLGDKTLVITLHGVLSKAEMALAKQPDGVAQIREYHRQLFASASKSYCKSIMEISGVSVREATTEVETSSGNVAGVFASGAIVQVFLLAKSVPSDTWSGTTADHSKEESKDGRCDNEDGSNL
ncbi:MAG: hypothetical protein DHS20C16_08510 [Phycisphaerae bacterium]|nr:MAG: hypothetical protein DHS20C16_08510 [Phycisphaerae bacterium]